MLRSAQHSGDLIDGQHDQRVDPVVRNALARGVEEQGIHCLHARQSAVGVATIRRAELSESLTSMTVVLGVTEHGLSRYGSAMPSGSPIANTAVRSKPGPLTR
jgi:hypothetical protein